MAKTKLATAYVQVVPTTEGLNKKLSNAMSGAAPEAGEAYGRKFSSSMLSKVGWAAVGVAIGKTIRASIDEGASLQQSRGGVDTLFKKDAAKIKKYADEAYKTAGLSANAYMETVTGFSASLLQSLGGNTAEAADVANMAIIDMSDNVNKFGTDMQSIQYAYQGFAKKTYTMLDNLKLGYGGTKQEMERLLADAQALTGVKYDISHLNDVYEAIHVIQNQLGITGTTAEEVATTFEGSLASMAAAGKNVLAKLTLGEDISGPLKDLGETIMVFLKDNLGPMLMNFGEGVLEAAPGFVVDIAEALIDHAPELAKAGLRLGKALLEGVWTALKDWTEYLKDSPIGWLLAPGLKIGDKINEKLFPTVTLNQSMYESPSSGGDTFNFNVNARDLQEVDGLIRTADNARRIGRMGMA